MVLGRCENPAVCTYRHDGHVDSSTSTAVATKETKTPPIATVQCVVISSNKQP